MNKIIVLKEPIDKISNASDLFLAIRKIEIDHKKENFIVITLNTKNQIINSYIVSIGTLNASLIHPRETFRNAIMDNANSIILAHNHPSGHLKPSEDDTKITKVLVNAGDILGIKILDHIIFSDKDFLSLKEQNPDIF